MTYSCPMHPDITSSKPGMCPECHMALEKQKHSERDDAGDNNKHTGHTPNIFKQKFWISLLLTIPVLIFSEAIQTFLGFSAPSFFGSVYIPAILGIAIFLYGGLVFLRSARYEIAAKQPGMMTLISLAISVAFSYSLLITLGVLSGIDFWWELATLVTIMLLGHWLEMASVINAQSALKQLAKLLPDEAELVTSGGTKLVAVESLKSGDKILLRPGAQIPVDGKVLKGESKVNESMLTGESAPVPKIKDSLVIGGTVNQSGSLTVIVTKTGDETALAGIMKLVEEAQTSKSKTQLLADKAAYYLTFVAIGAAFATALGWSILTNAGSPFILERVVTVLIIACPHALGLAIPLVTAISTTKAAGSGLLIRQRSALEEARSVDVVLFDKTGTLTKGEQGVVEIVSDDKTKLLEIAGALESDSEHAIAKAIVNYAKKKRIKLQPATKFEAMEGRGAKAEIGGKVYYAGGPQLLKELGLNIPDRYQQKQSKKHEAYSRIFITNSDEILGYIMIADVIRDESKQAVKSLQDSGMKVMMLTGDSKSVAATVAGKLNIDDYYAEVLPEHKSDVVKKLQDKGYKVAMVGDGVNDAPALTQADIGIAIGAGTDVAIESAGIILASSDPRGVSKIIILSKKTYSKMVQNLIWATGYNALAIPLAAGVTASLGFVLSPAIGAVLMSASTVIVAVNAQLLRKLDLTK